MHKFRFPLNIQLFADEPAVEPGVEDVPAAGEQEDGAQVDPNVDPTPEIKDEKDFATALKAREAQLQKQYEEKYKGVESRAQMLDRVAKYHGFNSYEDYQAAFEEAERTKQAQDEANRLGIDEETYQQYLQPVNEKLNQYEKTIQELKEREAARQIDADVQRLKATYPDFDQHADDVFKLAIQKGYPLEDAYILTTHAAKLEAAKKETEQKVLANVTHRDQKQVISSGDQPSHAEMDPEKMSLKDIEEISRRVQRGERITL